MFSSTRPYMSSSPALSLTYSHRPCSCPVCPAARPLCSLCPLLGLLTPDSPCFIPSLPAGLCSGGCTLERLPCVFRLMLALLQPPSQHSLYLFSFCSVIFNLLSTMYVFHFCLPGLECKPHEGSDCCSLLTPKNLGQNLTQCRYSVSMNR